MSGSVLNIPVLYYHRVSPMADPQTGVTPEVFRRQMEILAALGYVGVTLDRALSWAGEGGRPETGTARPGRTPIALTFDDGYLDNYEHAAPILEERGFRATIYFVSERMGKRVDWTKDPVWRDHPLMASAQARELAERGFEAGSHTLTHPDLARIPDGEARREIAESRDRLSDSLSSPVTTFCYPYGSFRPIHAKMAQEAGYRAARTVLRYRVGRQDDLFRLPCRPISGRMSGGRFFLTAAAYRVGFSLLASLSTPDLPRERGAS
ncbi:MAG: polysaccharide deacetylase family protein [Leptospirillia bacterium]